MGIQYLPKEGRIHLILAPPRKTCYGEIRSTTGSLPQVEQHIAVVRQRFNVRCHMLPVCNWMCRRRDPRYINTEEPCSRTHVGTEPSLRGDRPRLFAQNSKQVISLILTRAPPNRRFSVEVANYYNDAGKKKANLNT